MRCQQQPLPCPVVTTTCTLGVKSLQVRTIGLHHSFFLWRGVGWCVKDVEGCGKHFRSAPLCHTTPGGTLYSVLCLTAPIAHLPYEGTSWSYSTQKYHDSNLTNTQAPLSSLVGDTHFGQRVCPGTATNQQNSSLVLLSPSIPFSSNFPTTSYPFLVLTASSQE